MGFGIVMLSKQMILGDRANKRGRLSRSNDKNKRKSTQNQDMKMIPTLITEQQENGYKAYEAHLDEMDDLSLPPQDFIEFYQRWQEEKGYFTDTHLLNTEE